MILKALYDYYQRCENLPALGMEFKEIGFIIVIDNNGNFLRFDRQKVSTTISCQEKCRPFKCTCCQLLI